MAFLPEQRNARRAAGIRRGIGPCARARDKPVGDAVLAAQHCKARVPDGFVLRHAVNMEGHIGSQPLLPRQVADGGMQVIGRIDLEPGDFEQDAVGRAQPQIQPHGVAQVAFHADGCGRYFLRGVAQGLQLALQRTGAPPPACADDPGLLGPVHVEPGFCRPFTQNAGTRQRRK